MGPEHPGGTPLGTIAIWSGTVESVPLGWAPCDGQEGRPDLRDRFIVGAGSAYAVGATGGSANATLPLHSHTVTDPGHSHTYYHQQGGEPYITGHQYVDRDGTTTTGTSTTGITIAEAGSDATNANLPPYYSLLYIIKVTGDLSDGLQGPPGEITQATFDLLVARVAELEARLAGDLVINGSINASGDIVAFSGT
jgi:microcystin-dependent protein